jgi:hypothetical protein
MEVLKDEGGGLGHPGQSELFVERAFFGEFDAALPHYLFCPP